LWGFAELQRAPSPGEREHSAAPLILKNNMNEKIDKLISRLVAPKGLTEQHRPTGGIWYYLYLKPRWVRRIFTDIDHLGIGHPEAWRNYLVPELAKHYKLTDYWSKRLAEQAYGMPRGRVYQVEAEAHKQGEKPGDWNFYYGADFPSRLDPEHEKRMLISEFSLNAAAATEKVKFVLVAHEKMNEADKKEVQKILGVRIPY